MTKCCELRLLIELEKCMAKVLTVQFKHVFLGNKRPKGRRRVLMLHFLLLFQQPIRIIFFVNTNDYKYHRNGGKLIIPPLAL